jgi:hypothetical protein
LSPQNFWKKAAFLLCLFFLPLQGTIDNYDANKGEKQNHPYTYDKGNWS